jgi:hypothetical protein
MIEIALSLAVIGFALVAIVGILPIGLGVQKQNRQETIINQDQSVFVNAIRNGAQGMDDLANYVIAITNISTTYNAQGVPGRPKLYGYTPLLSTINGAPNNPQFPITNGFRIVGLLGTPKYIPLGGGAFISNRVVAYVRALSGPANDRPPQNNVVVQDNAFTYRMIPEVTQFAAQYNDPNLQTNLHELRLTFQWPLITPKRLPPSQQSFRTMVGGTLQMGNEAGFPTNRPEYALYFFHPQTYVKGQ